MLALCGTMVGLSGCSGSISDTATPPTTTGVPTTTHESTVTPTSTRTPELNYSLLRTGIIHADHIDEEFEAPAIDQVVIGQEIAILYEAEVPVRNGVYESVVTVGLSTLEGPHDSMTIYNHEGSADGETTRIKGHQRQPTEDFAPGGLSVYVSVAEGLTSPSDYERFVIQIVPPTEEGGDN